MSNADDECPVCMFKGNEMVALSCNHYICLKCIMNIYMTSERASLKCPLCRRESVNFQRKTIRFQPTGTMWRFWRKPNDPFEPCPPVVVRAWVMHDKYVLTETGINISNGCGPTVNTQVFKLNTDGTVEYFYKNPGDLSETLKFETWNHNVPTWSWEP